MDAAGTRGRDGGVPPAPSSTPAQGLLPSACCLRVFWPGHAAAQPPASLVGWVSKHTPAVGQHATVYMAVVVDLAPGSSASSGERLSVARGAAPRPHDGGPPSIIGQLALDDAPPGARTRPGTGYWLTLTPATGGSVAPVRFDGPGVDGAGARLPPSCSVHVVRYDASLRGPLLLPPSGGVGAQASTSLQEALLRINAWQPDVPRGRIATLCDTACGRLAFLPAAVRRVQRAHGSGLQLPALLTALWTGGAAPAESAAILWCTLALNALLGLAAGHWLWASRASLASSAAAAGVSLRRDLLGPQLLWIREGAPGGLKLHAELGALLGAACSWWLQRSAQAYRAVLAPVLGHVLAGAALVSAFGGAASGLAAAHDTLLLLSAPLMAAFCAMAALYRTQLRCMAAMWRLSRGGALRLGAATPAVQAEGSGDDGGGGGFRMEKLIVGVLLLTPLLLLLPTTLVYYAYACAYHAALWGLRRALLLAGGLLLHGPAAAALVRLLLGRRAFPGTVWLSVDGCSDLDAGGGRTVPLTQLQLHVAPPSTARVVWPRLQRALAASGATLNPLPLARAFLCGRVFGVP